MKTRLARTLLAAAAVAFVPEARSEMVVRLTFDGQSLSNIGTLGGSASVEGTSVLTAGAGLGYSGSDGLRGNGAGNLLFSSSNFLNVGNFTLSTRIQRGATSNWQDFWGLGTDGSQAGNFLRLEDNGTSYALFEDAPAAPTPQVVTGANYEDSLWHNIVVTASGGTGGTLGIYVDGVLRASSSNAYSQNVSVLRLLSNSTSGNRRQNSNAYMDDVLAYNYGMGAAHVGHLNSVTSSSLANATSSEWVHNAGSATLAASKTVSGLYASADTVLNSGVLLTVSSGNVRLAGRNQWVQGGGSITSGTSTLTLFQDDTALTDASFNGASIADNASGAVSVVKSEAGLIRLRSRQSYSGSTTVNGGTLRLEHGAAGLGTSASRTYTVNSGATLEASTGDALADDAVTANTVNVNAGGTFRLSGGSNTAGLLDLGASGSAGAGTVSLTSTNASGALVLAGAAPTLRVRAAASGSTLSGAGFLSVKNADLTLDVADGAAADDLTASSALKSAAGSTVALVKSGSGRARLSALDNNFSGGIRVDAGVLEIASGGSSTSALTVNGGTLVVNGTASAGATTVTSGTLMGSGTLGAVSVASGAVMAPGNSPGKLTTGAITYAAGSILELEASDFTSTAAAATAANDYIVSTGAVSFAAGASPTVIRLFSWNQALGARGDATVFADSFAYSYDFLTAAGGISYNGSSTFDASLFDLDLSGFTNFTSGSWALSGDSSKLSLVYTPATVVLTVDVASGSAAASGTDLATIAPDNAFAKTGAGTLVVADAYDFSGGSAINAGAVRLSGSGALGSGTVLIASGATLELEGGASLANALSGVGTLSKVGAGSVSLAALQASGNPVSVSGGSLALTGSSSVGSLTAATNGTLDLAGSTDTTVIGALAVSGGSATLGGATSAASVSVSSGSLDLASGTLTASGAFAVSGGSATVGAALTAGSVTVSGGGLALSSTGSLTTAGAFTVSGGSATVASGATLSAGSLSVTGGTLTGNFATRNSAIATSSGGTVVINDGGTLSTTASFSGSGTVEYAGGGTLTLGAASTLTGTLRVTSGTLKGSVAGSLGAGTVSVASGGALDLSGTNRASNPFNLVLAGTGVAGSGALFNSGSVIWGNSGIVNLTLAANATVAVGGTGEGSRFDLRETGTLNLAGNTLTKSGGGLLVIKSSMGTAGTIDIAAGNVGLEYNFTGAATANAAITVRDGAGVAGYEGMNIGSAVTLQGTGAMIFSLGSTRSVWSNVILQGGGRYHNGSRVYGASDGLRVTGMSGTGNFLVSGGSQALYGSGSWTFDASQVSTIQLNAGFLEVSGGALTTNAVLEIGASADSGRAVDIWAGTLTVRGLAGGTSSTRIVSNNSQRLVVNTPVGETYTYSGLLANSTWSGTWMGLTKTGAGTQVLAGTVTSNADTNVNGGILRLTGTMSTSSNTTNRTLAIAREAGSTATFEVAGGTLNYGGSTGINIGDAGAGTFTLSSGSVAVGSGGVWLGDGSSVANGTLNIQGGAFTAASNLIVGTRGTGTVNLTGGTATFSAVQLGHAVASGQTATVNLDGGTLVTSAITRANGTGRLFADGGTLRASASSATFLQGLTTAEIEDGGLTLDTNGFDVAIAQNLLESASSLGGALTKVGSGVLTLGGTNTFSGGTFINGGTVVAGTALAFGSGSITLGSGGILDANNLIIANTVVFSGGTIINLPTGVGVTVGSGMTAEQINALPVDRINIGAGSSLDLAGVTKAVVLTGTPASLAGLANFTGTLAVAGNVDLSAVGNRPGAGATLELVSGGTLDFGSSTPFTGNVVYKGGAIQGAFAGTLAVSGSNLALSDADLPGGTVVVDTGASVDVSNFTGSLRLTGSGAVQTGLSTFAGSLELASGAELSLTASDAPAATITVASGGTLKGTGTVGDTTLAAGGTLAPGNSPGTQTYTNLTLEAGAFIDFEIAETGGGLYLPTAGVSHDTLSVSGLLDISGLSAGNTLTLNLISLIADGSAAGDLGDFDPAGTFAFDLITYGAISSYEGSISQYFTLDGTALTYNGAPVDMQFWSLADTGTSLQLQYSPIPEPSTYGLMLGGLALAGAAIRRRRKNAK